MSFISVIFLFSHHSFILILLSYFNFFSIFFNFLHYLSFFHFSHYCSVISLISDFIFLFLSSFFHSQSSFNSVFKSNFMLLVSHSFILYSSFFAYCLVIHSFLALVSSYSSFILFLQNLLIFYSVYLSHLHHSFKISFYFLTISECSF
jgi:hypothetical protein